MNSVNFEGAQCVDNNGLTTESNLRLSQQCSYATSKTNRMLGFIIINFKNKDIILFQKISLVRFHLEYAVQFLFPHHTKGIRIKSCQMRATKMITFLRKKSYEERLAQLSLLSLEKRGRRGKLFQNMAENISVII